MSHFTIPSQTLVAHPRVADNVSEDVSKALILLEEPPKFVAVDEQTNHEIMHALCFGKADRAADQALDSGPKIDVVRSKYSYGLAVVVFEEPTEPLSALDCSFRITYRSPKFGVKSQIALSSGHAATRSRTSSCYDLFNKDIT